LDFVTGAASSGRTAEIQMLGYPPEEYIGRHVGDFHAVKRDQGAAAGRVEPRLEQCRVHPGGWTTDRQRAVAAGFDSHIAKPYDPLDLLRTIAVLTR
jgi:hypothetical protein